LKLSEIERNADRTIRTSEKLFNTANDSDGLAPVGKLFYAEKETNSLVTATDPVTYDLEVSHDKCDFVRFLESRTSHKPNEAWLIA
jgi:hypothetical protein